MNYKLDLSKWNYQNSITARQIPIEIVNSYMIVEVVDDVIHLITPHITTCRDTFLHNVDKLLRSGVKPSLTIALFVQKRVNYNTSYLADNFPRFYQKTFRTQPDVGIVCIGDTELGVLLFPITPETYCNPASFWLLTQYIRYTITGFSKVIPSAPEYHSSNYNSIANTLHSSVIPALVTQPILIGGTYDYFFNLHSPLGLVTTVHMAKSLIVEATMKKTSSEWRHATGVTLGKYSRAFLYFYPGIKIPLYQATRYVGIEEIFAHCLELSEEMKP